MKKVLLFIFLAFAVTRASAQKVNLDSLKHVLAAIAVDDTARYHVYDEIQTGFGENKPDSSIYYFKQELALATKHHDMNVANNVRLGIAYDLYIKGEYVDALNKALPVLQYYETGKDAVNLANTYNLVGNIYKGQENYPKAIYYYKRCLQTATIVKDIADMSYGAFNLGEVYEQTNVLDSSLYYAAMAEAYCIANHGFYLEIVPNTYGNVYLKLKNYKKAIFYLKKAYTLSVKAGNKRSVVIICISLSRYYKQINNIDSAVYWAKEGLAGGKTVAANKLIYQSADLLSGLYEAKHQTDSAFKYLKLSSITKESVFSTAKFQAIEALSNSEEKRNAEIAKAKETYQNNLKLYALLFIIGIVLIAAFLLWRNSRNRQKALNLLKEQKKETEIQKEAAENALYQLKQTQTQLIQSEKMASLGELTAGIAHEIQNPLNFVNNFSEVNKEMVDELEEELKKGNIEDALAIAADIKQNEEKINHHGKRADFIVKGMLLHSRNSSGEKELTNINVMANEFFKLSYHGLRAKDKNFNAEMVTDFATDLPMVKIAHQDIGRVLLNLFNNAFYAVNQKQKTGVTDYKPEVSVSTSIEKNNLFIKVKDNGNGIPDAIKDKIMQPFFTTKPTGEGTGLGLSLSYDIVVKGHGGKIEVNTIAGEGSEFIITLNLG